MREFVDLRGASGGAYRFRRWAAGADASPVAGNYAVLKPDGQGFTVLLTAVSNDLSKPPGTVKAAMSKADSIEVFVRLNVSRSIREAENDDINAYYALPQSDEGR